MNTTKDKKKQAKKRQHSDDDLTGSLSTVINDFHVQYATTSSTVCVCCFQKIGRRNVQIMKKVPEIDIHVSYHMECFKKHSVTLGWKEPADNFPGFDKLREKQKMELKDHFMSEDDNNNVPDMKKLKTGSIDDVNQIIGDRIASQSRGFWELREIVRKELKAKHRIAILKANAQFIPETDIEILDHVTDVIYYGALQPCTECKNGKFFFRNESYVCTGHLSRFAKCNNVVKYPVRRAAQIPNDIKRAHTFLKKKFQIEIRATKFVPTNLAKAKNTMNSKSFFMNSVTMAQKWKNGVTIDADCGLDNVHVYTDNESPYDATLVLVDVELNENSYHRMQLLKSDNGKRYWLFQKWGRISTIIGGQSLDEFNTSKEAKEALKESFAKLTGNRFESPTLEKKPDKFQVLDIEFDQFETVLDQLIDTHLDESVYQLMKLICDKKAMKNTTLTFDIDTDYMPLGKVSGDQIDIATNILNELSALVQNANGTKGKFIEASNRFYTLIPHKCAPQVAPPIINTAELIAQKFDMIKHLQNIKLTYSALNDAGEKINPLDHIYEKLNVNIKQLDPSSAECTEIQKYFSDSGHECECGNCPSLGDVEKVFEVVRDGEDERYSAFKHFDNRRLLWHGTELTNFIGILSNGLKIAPKEVTCHGRRFGKAIYFTDSKTKAARFSALDGKNNGALLLCEVALGKGHEVFWSDDFVSLPDGYHSVKGVGKISQESLNIRSDGVQVPTGDMILDRNINAELVLNEFAVYNEAQVKIRYVVMVHAPDEYSSESSAETYFSGEDDSLD